VMKFLPQNDILAHPQIKAFISHAGLLSTHEAMWHGKPIIGIPFFVDQGRNMEKIAAMEVAVKVDFRILSVKVFKASIKEVLDNPKYSTNVKRISRMFTDKPQKPLETAVWWTEFVMRNPNLENMKSPTLKLGPFASKSYDVLLAIVLILYLFAYLLKKLFKVIFSCGKSKTKLE
jgi:glucuronosyltransferase